jgi:uncharacterized membrane protein
MKLAVRSLCAALFMAALFGAMPAKAALTVCNQTSYVIDTAVGYQERIDAVTQGWARIIPGKCANIYPFPLSGPAYYLYAKSSQVHSGPGHAWGGNVRLCAKGENFTLHQPLIMETCPEDSFIMPFSRVDPKGKHDWSTVLTESPQLSSFELARQAGIVRLLIDAGYKITANPKTANAALAAFRARVHLSEKASSADLFNALQSVAMKAAAPAGYSICNDSSGEIYAAIGFREGKDWTSQGWWKVEAGACARVITQSLHYDKVYLFVEGANNPRLVGGPEKFCIADIEYETSQKQNCKTTGKTEEGFAITDTRGLTGYAAHVGNKGLMSPAGHMPK